MEVSYILSKNLFLIFQETKLFLKKLLTFREERSELKKNLKNHSEILKKAYACLKITKLSNRKGEKRRISQISYENIFVGKKRLYQRCFIMNF